MREREKEVSGREASGASPARQVPRHTITIVIQQRQVAFIIGVGHGELVFFHHVLHCIGPTVQGSISPPPRREECFWHVRPSDGGIHAELEQGVKPVFRSLKNLHLLQAFLLKQAKTNNKIKKHP